MNTNLSCNNEEIESINWIKEGQICLWTALKDGRNFPWMSFENINPRTFE